MATRRGGPVSASFPVLSPFFFVPICKLEDDTPKHRILHCPIYVDERKELEKLIGKPCNLVEIGKNLNNEDVIKILKLFLR
jgi:hypothetical protein